jgi:hypothetical protein
MPQTPLQYYENEDNYGGYQYVPISVIIDSMLLETQDDDSFLKGTKRSKIVYHAREGLRNLSMDVANDVLAFEITVPDSLYWALPQDYVNYVRISIVNLDSDGGYRLYPLDINYNIHAAIGYLQDNDANLLFDDNGYILKADSTNAIAKPYKRFSVYNYGNMPSLNASKLSKHGEFTIDERRGLIMFSSDLADKNVVIEYVSDGLQNELWEQSITVHKYLRKALEDHIYYECIARKRNVPFNEKYRANQKYKSSRHRAVLARADFDMLKISRIMTGATKIF